MVKTLNIEKPDEYANRTIVYGYVIEPEDKYERQAIVLLRLNSDRLRFPSVDNVGYHSTLAIIKEIADGLSSGKISYRAYSLLCDVAVQISGLQEPKFLTIELDAEIDREIVVKLIKWVDYYRREPFHLGYNIPEKPGSINLLCGPIETLKKSCRFIPALK